MKKINICCICHKELDHKPIRLIKLEYGLTYSDQYKQTDKFDICNNCFKLFENWIKKHKEK